MKRFRRYARWYRQAAEWKADCRTWNISLRVAFALWLVVAISFDGFKADDEIAPPDRLDFSEAIPRGASGFNQQVEFVGTATNGLAEVQRLVSGEVLVWEVEFHPGRIPSGSSFPATGEATLLPAYTYMRE